MLDDVGLSLNLLKNLHTKLGTLPAFPSPRLVCIQIFPNVHSKLSKALVPGTFPKLLGNISKVLVFSSSFKVLIK